MMCESGVRELYQLIDAYTLMGNLSEEQVKIAEAQKRILKKVIEGT